MNVAIIIHQRNHYAMHHTNKHSDSQCWKPEHHEPPRWSFVWSTSTGTGMDRGFLRFVDATDLHDFRTATL